MAYLQSSISGNERSQFIRFISANAPENPEIRFLLRFLDQLMTLKRAHYDLFCEKTRFQVLRFKMATQGSNPCHIPIPAGVTREAARASRRGFLSPHFPTISKTSV